MESLVPRADLESLVQMCIVMLLVFQALKMMSEYAYTVLCHTTHLRLPITMKVTNVLV